MSFTLATNVASPPRATTFPGVTFVTDGTSPGSYLENDDGQRLYIPFDLTGEVCWHPTRGGTATIRLYLPNIPVHYTGDAPDHPISITGVLVPASLPLND